MGAAAREGVEPFASADPDTSRIWWTDAGVHQNLTFPVQPDPISGMHCWHQAVRVKKAGPGDRYGDIVGRHREGARKAYEEWLSRTRPAILHSPDGTRRPVLAAAAAQAGARGLRATRAAVRPVRSTRADAEPTRLLLRALAVGLIAGAAAALLRWAATEAPHLLWPGPDLVQGVALATPLRRVAVPALGGLVAGVVLALGSRWAGAARGWDILEAVVLRNGVLPGRSAIVRATSSLVTQASAGAVGREGPIVLVAAATASRLGQYLGVPPRQLRVLVGCGIAAGLACAYNTPLGAALFTMEIIFGTFALEAFAPLAVASAAATLLSWASFGHDPVFRVPP